ncbi:hypothetical protein Avbf_18552 [Armadillidium vulgare]|nr:hypothetical protein Avbf_18552 [Armadillidium vulgare]
MEKNNIHERNNDTKIYVKNEVEVEEESFSVDDEEKEIGIKEEYFNSDAKEKTEVNEECFNVKSEVKDPLEQVSSLDQSQVINSKAKRKASRNKRSNKRRMMRYKCFNFFFGKAYDWLSYIFFSCVLNAISEERNLISS